MKSPLKFLDPYTKDDILYYFGRETDTINLYEMVKKNRIVLVYGPSGTGKTSLVQCGLANKFNPTDWIPFYIRRKENVNSSLLGSLKNFFPETAPSPTESKLAAIRDSMGHVQSKAPSTSSFFASLGIDFTQEEMEKYKDPDQGTLSSGMLDQLALLVFYLMEVSEQSLRPIYLVFDQLEELLMYGSAEEKTIFIETLKIITTYRKLVACHVIILMREEFFAVFDKFESEIPGITDRRMRVDPMQESDIKEVLLKTLTYPPFHITLEKEKESINDIFRVLADKKGEVSLPYLQVYLDQLWQSGYEKQWPKEYEGEGYPPLTFTEEEILSFGEIRDVLQKFLTARKNKIGEKLKKKFPNIAPDFIDKVLKELVSDFGTKFSVVYELSGNTYVFPEIARHFFKDFPAEPLAYTLRKLEDSKLIRKEARVLELSHDILAKLVDEQRDARERKRIRIRVLIKDYMKESTGSLSLAEVHEWQPEIHKSSLNTEEMAFFNKWKTIRLKEEARQEWKNRNKKMWLLTNIIGLAVFILLCAFLTRSYFRTKRFAYVYYAFNFFNSEVGHITQKEDALKLSYYIYDKTADIDSSTRSQVQRLILKLASDTALQNAGSVHSLNLLSDQLFQQASSIDISGDGRYFCVEYDSLRTGTVRKRFRLFRTGQEAYIAQFDSLYYAYFLNHSNTLLLATSSDTVESRLNRPGGLILFDCNKAADPGYKGRSIFGTRKTSYIVFDGSPELNADRFSDYDSYDVRLTADGRLMTPYIDLRDYDASHRVEFLDSNNRPVGQNYHTNFTVSNSRDNRWYMLGSTGQGDGASAYARFYSETTLRIVDQHGKQVGPSFSNATWGDFTLSNAILYFSGDHMQLVNGPTSPQAFTVRNSVQADPYTFRYGYAVGNESQLLIRTKGDSIILKSFADTSLHWSWPEHLAGIHYGENTMVTVPHGDSTSACELGNRIYKRNFLQQQNTPVASITFPTCVVNTAFNESNGWLLVETKADTVSGNAFVYVLDKDLHKKGSFVITPNDTYLFSHDGHSLLLIRNRRLSIFNLQSPLTDFSDFPHIYSWMQQNTHEAELDSLKNRYKIKFPNIFSD